MTSPTPKPSGWSDERRATHAAAIRRWKPWEKSTGPRTATGKARAAQNAYKHGRRALPARLMGEALAAQNTCTRIARRMAALTWRNPPNEVLARMRCLFTRYDHIFHVRLMQALRYERLCKNLAFSGPLGQIVNANDNDSS
jgi:hypothetical protein